MMADDLTLKPRVKLVGIISAVPYAVYDATGGDLLGYADDHMGPMTMSREMKNLQAPIHLDIVEIDESAWD